MRRLAAAAVAGLILASCAAPDDGATLTPGKTGRADCCGAVRLVSPDGARTLVFAPDAAERVEIRLSAGWLNQIALGEGEVPMAAWNGAPDVERLVRELQAATDRTPGPRRRARSSGYGDGRPAPTVSRSGS